MSWKTTGDLDRSKYQLYFTTTEGGILATAHPANQDKSLSPSDGWTG